MTTYEIKVNRSAQKVLDRLLHRINRQVGSAIDSLAEEPRPHGTTKIKGEADSFRIRVGDYRIVYEVNDAARLVTVRTIGHRSVVYRGLVLIV